MKRISVLIPDADIQYHAACCLTMSRQAVVHGFALHPAPLLKHSRFFASIEEYKGEFDLEVWLRRIGEIVAERRIDVVLPIAEFAIRTLSEHRHALGWGEKLPPLPEPRIFAGGQLHLLPQSSRQHARLVQCDARSGPGWHASAHRERRGQRNCLLSRRQTDRFRARQ